MNSDAKLADLPVQPQRVRGFQDSSFEAADSGNRFRSLLLKRQMPGLDALRGLAVLAVVTYHGLSWNPSPQQFHQTWTAYLPGLFAYGWLGVDLFFVLSGFLITGILFDGKGRPRQMRNFYMRRLLRIYPILVVVLLFVKLIGHVSWAYIGLCLGYMANLYFVFHLAGGLYGPLWSLAVEEQFYLAWPWLVKLLSKRTAVYFACASILFSPLLRYLTAAGIVNLGDPHWMTWMISDNLAMGALLALILRSSWGTVQNVKKICGGLFFAGALLLVAGIPLGILNIHSPMSAALETVPFEWIFGALLLLSLLIGELPIIFALTRPLRFLGYISYGLYLFHVLVFDVADTPFIHSGFYKVWSVKAWIFRFVLDFTLSVIIAYLSRRHFEEFFLKLKGKFTPKAERHGMTHGITVANV
jgi:peptidoglycan/LPS O-acetylase OafA/YrhL